MKYSYFPAATAGAIEYLDTFTGNKVTKSIWEVTCQRNKQMPQGTWKKDKLVLIQELFEGVMEIETFELSFYRALRSKDGWGENLSGGKSSKKKF